MHFCISSAAAGTGSFGCAHPWFRPTRFAHRSICLLPFVQLSQVKRFSIFNGTSSCSKRDSSRFSSRQSRWWMNGEPRGADSRRVAFFLLQLLLFKLMFMSGVVKLTSGDDSWWNLTALDYHYWTQPLPTVLGWYGAQTSEWLKKTCTCHRAHCRNAGAVFYLGAAAVAILRFRSVRRVADHDRADRQLLLLQSAYDRTVLSVAGRRTDCAAEKVRSPGIDASQLRLFRPSF